MFLRRVEVPQPLSILLRVSVVCRTVVFRCPSCFCSAQHLPHCYSFLLQSLNWIFPVLFFCLSVRPSLFEGMDSYIPLEHVEHWRDLMRVRAGSSIPAGEKLPHLTHPISFFTIPFHLFIYLFICLFIYLSHYFVLHLPK